MADVLQQTIPFETFQNIAQLITLEHIALKASVVPGMIRELNRVDNIYIKPKQLKWERCGFVAHVA